MLTHRLQNGAYEAFEYDSNWQLITKWNPKFGGVPAGADPHTTYTFYGPSDHPAWSGRIKTETLPANASTYQASNTYEYDREFVNESEFGILTNGGSTEKSGRGLVTKITHADGTYQQFRHNIYGDKIWEKNELGQRTVFTYDDYGRVTSVKDPLNNQTQTSYLKWGQTSSYVTTSSLPFVTTLPSGKQTYFYYDDNWRKTQVTQAPGVTGQEATTTFTYDDVGNLKTQTNPRGKTTTNFYDFLNRVIHTDDPMVCASPVPHQNANGHTVSTTYNSRGNKETELRANGQLIEYLEYDPMNRLKKVKTWRDATTADTREMTYDLAGNILTRKDERGNIYTYGYDASGRKTSLQYPSTPTTTEQWSFDDAGNLYTYTTRAAKTRTGAFDNRNREIGYSWDDENTLGGYKEYDTAGRVLWEMSDLTSISYTYDAAGRLTSETQQNSPNFRPRSVTYHYDGLEGADGKRTTIDYPYGQHVTYTYTARNQVQSITSAGWATGSYVYDLNGNEYTRTLDNGATETRTYNDVDRLTSLDHVKSTTSFSRFDYTHNRVSDCLTRKETIASAAVLDQYEYDLDDQVTKAKYNYNSQSDTQDRLCSYTYDPAGNRSGMSDSITGSISYTPNELNQYTAAGSASLLYDLNGNLTSQLGWTYEYDAQSRLIAAYGNSHKYGFIYDTRNRCVCRTVMVPGGLNGVWNLASARYFYYDGWDVIAEQDQNGAQIARYLHGVREDELISVSNTSGISYYHTDAEGSVAALTNTSGNVVERYTYDIFGNPKFKNGSGTVINETAYGNRFLFTGREWLADIGLYDYRNRIYSAEYGRFLQPDPKSFDADPSNLYRYCGNEPIDRTDPMGLAGAMPNPTPTPTVTVELQRKQTPTGTNIPVWMTVKQWVGPLTKVNDFNLWTFRMPNIESTGPILIRQRDGTLKNPSQAKTRAELLPAFAERQGTGRYSISQGILLQTTLPKNASQQLINEEMKRPAELEKSARSGPLREMANEVQKMPFHSAQEAENAANDWMGIRFDEEVRRLSIKFDNNVKAESRY